MPDTPATPTPSTPSTPSTTPSTGTQPTGTAGATTPQAGTTSTTPTQTSAPNPYEQHNLNSKIPLGFNLEGYTVPQRDSAAGASAIGGSGGVNGGMGFGGVDVSWGGGLKDNRWVADANLKQVQIEGTYYQSVPMAIKTDSGLEYAILSDGTGFVDGTGLLGGCAYGGSIYADCRLSDEARFSKWAAENQRYNGGSDDFVVGCAFCWKTLVAYMQEFYGLSISQHQVAELCRKKVLNLEIVYNTGVEGAGKAYRIKCVDSSGNRGDQGSVNAVGKWAYEFDVIDTMVALLVLDSFKDVVTLHNTDLGQVNSDQFYFPWHSSGYDYKKGNIGGFSPSGLKGLGMTDNGKSINELKGLSWKSIYTSKRGHMLARARFFGDPALKDQAMSVVPGLSEEFFNCNYAEGAATGMSMSQGGGSVPPGASYLYGPAQEIAMKVQAKHYPYGATTLKKDSSGGWDSSSRHVDCSGFVRWVLVESGVCVSDPCCVAVQFSASLLQKHLAPGYSAYDIHDASQLQPGDIMVYGNAQTDANRANGGLHHTCILQSLNGTRVMAFDMGGHPEKDPQPNGSYGTDKMDHAVRIIKNA